MELTEKIEADFYTQDVAGAKPQEPPENKTPVATKITGKMILEAIRQMDAEERRRPVRVPSTMQTKRKTRTRRLNSDKVLFSFARGRERCDRNGHAVFLRTRVDFATTGSEITGISTSSTKLK